MHIIENFSITEEFLWVVSPQPTWVPMNPNLPHSKVQVYRVRQSSIVP